jgi:hypothetical protein
MSDLLTAVGDQFVLDIESRPRRARELWQAGPTVLAFLRHFG